MHRRSMHRWMMHRRSMYRWMMHRLTIHRPTIHRPTIHRPPVHQPHFVHSHLLDINLICVDSWNIERNIQLKGKYCLSIAYSPTGTHLAAGGLNGMINICDIQTGQVKSIDGHAMPVRSLAFSHDGQKLVSVSDDGQIKFFEVLVFFVLIS